MLIKKIAIFLTICIIFVVSSCSQIGSKVKKIDTQNNIILYEEFITNDGELTFKIYNQGNFQESVIQKIKNETLEAYEIITNSINTGYNIPTKINVYLYNGEGRPYSTTTDITLYQIQSDTYSLVHELTHVLLGYGDETISQYGTLTQEGYAVYMQNKYGNPALPSLDIPIHKIMKYIYDNNKNLPLYKLVDPKISHKILNPATRTWEDYTLVWIDYIQSGSFVTFLIDEYGIKKFSMIYNSPNLETQIETTYGKKLGELENEWLNFINSNYEVVSDKYFDNYFYNYITSLNNIDEDYFKRE